MKRVCLNIFKFVSFKKKFSRKMISYTIVHKISKKRRVQEGGPQCAYSGYFENLAQSNTSASCIEKDNKSRFVDYLTMLKK